MPLSDGEAHIWLANPEYCEQAGRLSTYHHLLSADEHARLSRFRVASEQREYLVAHALLRVMLSRYGARAPEAWEFALEPGGRPLLAPLPDPPLYFSLTHTQGCAAVLIARVQTVGVDCEALTSRAATLSDQNAHQAQSNYSAITGDHYRTITVGTGSDLTESFSFLAAPEQQAIRAAPAADRVRAALGYWTLKEAYLKAHGSGLTIAPEQIVFSIQEGAPIRVMADAREQPGIGDRLHWHFVQFTPTGQHIGAGAFGATSPLPVTFRIGFVIP